MTRIFTEGAEMGDAIFWTWNDDTSPITAVTSPAPIGGTYSFKGAWLGAFRIVPDLSEFYLRYRVRNTNKPYTPSMIALGWRHGTTSIGRISCDSLYRFNAEVGTTEVAVSDVVFESDTWFLIEVHYSIDDIAGRFEVFVDGTQVIDFTGDTKPGTDSHIDNIYMDGSAYHFLYFDDLALNDTAGIVDNTWCGDGIITKMIPNGNGADSDWINSNGDSVNNYSYVDEFPNDGDLTYVRSDGSVSGTQDQYTLSDLDYSNKTVLRIYPEVRARKTSADGTTIKIGILPSGGVDDLCAARTLYVDYYARIVGDEYLVNPFDSAVWEEADLDPLEMIVEVG